MKRVLILGATSAIAAEVAQIHAGRGDRLHLVGRNEAKLAAVAAKCASTNVTTAIADFGGLDTVLIAHGDLGDQLATEASWDDAEATLRNNFTSVVSLLIPLANHME